MMVVLGILAVLVVAGAGAAFWFFKLRDPLKGEDFYKFHVEQKWPWELTLNPEQERAFMAGLEAYDNDKGCYPKREEGILRVYEPMMLVSLFRLTEQFATMGQKAVEDPATAINLLVQQAAQSEGQGVLYMVDDWMGDEIDGMDKYEFTSAVMYAMSAQDVKSEFAGAYGDEDYGYATMGVLAKMPEHVDQMYQDAFAGAGDQAPLNNRLDVWKEVTRPEDPAYADAHVRADVEKAKYINTLMFCFERIVEEYHVAREAMRGAAPSDVLSVVMARMVAEGRPGFTWVRQPNQEQHDLAIAILSGRG